MEHVDLARGQTNRVRRARELETHVRELFRVLPLPRRASAIAKSFALRFGGERFDRRSVPRRLHEDERRQKPDDERQCVRLTRGQDRQSPSRFLLLDLPEHASLAPPRVRDGASTSAAITRTNSHYL